MKFYIKLLYAKLIYPLFYIFPLKNKVVFSSFSGRKCDDNPKYISQKLLESHPEILQIWLYKYEPFDLPPSIKQVKWGTIGMTYHLATAKVWVDSHTKPLWVQKRKKQFYLETWHGGLGIKKIEGDAIETLTKEAIARSKHNSKMADLLVSNSTWLTNIYERAFWYDGEILECGYPKNDIFFHSDEHEIIRKKVLDFYQLPDDAYYVLYAPTFREGIAHIDYGLDLDTFQSQLQEILHREVFVLYRLHPLLAKEKQIFHTQNNHVIDVTDYFSMQYLLLTVDVLITDYSSCIFDFAMTYKPAFLYANDLEAYQKERGLYFDLHKLPFSVSESQTQLVQNIEQFSNKEYSAALKEYFSSVGLKENGHATEQLVDIIFEKVVDRG